jgi:hypothetical protein
MTFVPPYRRCTIATIAVLFTPTHTTKPFPQQKKCKEGDGDQLIINRQLGTAKMKIPTRVILIDNYDLVEEAVMDEFNRSQKEASIGRNGKDVPK